MKKIVFVIEQLYGGGAERVTAALMNELCNDAEIYLLMTYMHDEEQDYPIDERIVRYMFHDSSKNQIDKFASRIAFLRKKVTEIDPDCIVSLAGAGTCALLTVALLGKKIPLILSERNDPKRHPSTKLLRTLRLWAYSSCNGLVFQTREARDYFPDCVGKKSTVILNPITAKLPDPYLGIREKRIIDCCRLTRQKNLDLLIDAFSEIAQEFPDMTLEIWGEGPERARLEEKIKTLDMRQRVILPGYSSDIHSRMGTSSMFVSSSDYEGISNSMLEAIALGVPTICTDCPAGGARETICHGENGLLVPVGDCAAMADAMRSVLTDTNLAERISSNGVRLRETASARAVAQQWLAYIYKVIG